MSLLRKLAKKLIKLKITDNLPKNYAGYFSCFNILIRPNYINDKCLIEHEYTHAVQMLRTLGLHCLLYKLSKTYRLHSEVEAYAVQYCCLSEKSPKALNRFAEFLATKYNLNITIEEAKRLLLEKIKKRCPDRI